MLRLLRTNTVPHLHEESTTWLELFFDLVYVAILVEMGGRLGHNLSPQGLIEYALLFIPIWLSWLEPVYYSRRFPTDDIGHRLLTVAYMAVILFMAFELHGVTEDNPTPFLLAFAASKAILALMYVWAWYRHPQYRTFTLPYTILFSVLTVVWVVIALWDPLGYAWWAVAIALSFFAPSPVNKACGFKYLINPLFLVPHQIEFSSTAIVTTTSLQGKKLLSDSICVVSYGTVFITIQLPSFLE